MFPPGTATRVRDAHRSIIPIYQFLEKYDRWVAGSEEQHCDFALGNPQAMPLEGFVTALRDAAIPRNAAWYGYKTYEPSSRDIVRTTLNTLTGFEYPAENVFMTNGATGALLVLMNALLGPRDEAIFTTPPWFFYEGMILNCGGKPVPVELQKESFELDVDAITHAITDRTRLVIVNSPNNPTGKVFAAGALVKLGSALDYSSKRIGRPIYLVSDECYRNVVFDGVAFLSPCKFYKNSIMVYSYGKTLLTPGQRVGYLALSPWMDDLDEMRTIIYSTQILSGWAMTSALMQHCLAELEELSLDVSALQRRRDRLVRGLRDCGYEVRTPEGAFYVTPKIPIDDDVRFADELAKHCVFCLPGSVVNHLT